MKDYFHIIFIRLLSVIIKIFSKEKSFNFSSILIISPHPDDEILGLGGIILQILQKGGKANLVYLTDGEGSGVWPDKDEIKNQRISLSEKASLQLGLSPKDIIHLHLPDGEVPYPGQAGFDKAVQNIRQLIEKLKPDATFATHILDYWPFDHVACAHIASEAVNKSEHKTQLWYYWVWAWYNLRPWQLLKIKFRKLNRIDIKEQIPQKRALMAIYLDSLTRNGKPWSGILPKSLVEAFSLPVEIIERII
jgi:LmbE family N-acetylglucosaminyl deacetylase